MANNKEAKNKDVKGKKETKNKKSFFKDFKAELKKVIWPSPKQLINSTTAVVVIVLLTAAIVFVLDVAFDLFNQYGINKLKSHIRGEEIVQQVEDEHNHDHEHEEENTVVDTNTTGVEISNVTENTAGEIVSF